MMIRFPSRAVLYAGLGLAVCTADLASHGRAITRTIPLGAWRQNNSILKQIARDIGPYRLLAPQSLVSDREAWQRGIAKVQAYEPVPLVRWGEFFAALYPAEDPARMLTGFHNSKLSKYRQPLVHLLGVKYAAVVGHADEPPPGWKLVKRDLIQLEANLRGGKLRGIKYSLFENQQMLPRAFVVHHVQAVGSDREAFEALKTLDPRQSVIVGPGFPDLPANDEAGLTPVEIVTYKPTRVTLQTDMQQPGVLCLTDFHYPGWHATDNGVEVAIFAGDFIFRAVPLSAGKHEVTFEFSPPGMKLGGIVSLFAWVLWAFGVWKAMAGSAFSVARRSAS